MLRRAVVLIALATGLPAAASAQISQLQVDRTSGPQFGISAVYSNDRSDAWGYGAQLRMPIDWNIAFEPNVAIWNRNGATTWQANADLLALDRRGHVYLRAGLAALKTDNVTMKYGVNAGIGVDGPYLLETPLRPFAEARWTAVDGRVPFRALVGINFSLGRR